MKCQHNIQKRLPETIDTITMWCINCGGLKIGSADWILPLMKPPKSEAVESLTESDIYAREYLKPESD